MILQIPRDLELKTGECPRRIFFQQHRDVGIAESSGISPRLTPEEIRTHDARVSGVEELPDLVLQYWFAIRRPYPLHRKVNPHRPAVEGALAPVLDIYGAFVDGFFPGRTGLSFRTGALIVRVVSR